MKWKRPFLAIKIRCRNGTHKVQKMIKNRVKNGPKNWPYFGTPISGLGRLKWVQKSTKNSAGRSKIVKNASFLTSFLRPFFTAFEISGEASKSNLRNTVFLTFWSEISEILKKVSEICLEIDKNVPKSSKNDPLLTPFLRPFLQLLSHF